MMRIQAFSLAIRRRPCRAILAAILAAAVVYVGASALALQQNAANHVVEISTEYQLIPSLDALAKQSDVVVVGHVLEQVATHIVTPPEVKPQPFKPAPPPDAIKTAVAAGQDDTAPMTQTVRKAPPSLPVTTFEVKVDRVLGGNADDGQRLSVIQPGGQVTVPTFPDGPKLQRTLVDEGDPLLVPGQQEVLFLHRVGEDENGASEDDYYIVGGPQGRFHVNNNAVTPLLVGIPLAQGHVGESLPSFIAAIEKIEKGEHNDH
jgi:hypothetical protein